MFCPSKIRGMKKMFGEKEKEQTFSTAFFEIH
jgi:hypothetical protein